MNINKPAIPTSNEDILQKIVMPFQSASGYISNTLDEIYCVLSDEQKNDLQSALNLMDEAMRLTRKALPTPK